MRAITFSQTGGTDVLDLVEHERPEPGPGQVLVEMTVSGVNPTDWKSRSGATPSAQQGEQVPNQDGAGEVVAVGEGVPGSRVGERVWLWLANYLGSGTAAEVVAIDADHAVALPEGCSDDLGAALGVPAMTAHRALTVAEDGPDRLTPGALEGRVVLVAGGAGAVGHAAIELARWAGATVISTVSGPEKGALATAAGAHHVVNYRDRDAAAQITAIAPDGVHVVVEVSPAANAALDNEVCANNAVVAYYANNGGNEIALSVRPTMSKNLRWQGMLLYTVTDAVKADAVAGVTAALRDGALRVGQESGLPLHRFPLAETAAAHQAVEDGAVGKVLIDVRD